MTINKDSNAYTILFAFILVVVVGGLLAFISTSLKPLQLENLRNEKMQNILNCLPGLKSIERKDAGKEFEMYVKDRIILNYEGEVISSKDSSHKIDEKDQLDAFNVDLLKEKKAIADITKRKYPLFICEVDSKSYYVVPVMGKGLWDAIWGFISLEVDGETVAGAIFDHKSETPGLGAEINKDPFEYQFNGLKAGSGLPEIYNADDIMNLSVKDFKSIKVLKPGNIKDTLREVNGISGGTFTSVGVQEMLHRTMYVYYKYFKEQKLAN